MWAGCSLKCTCCCPIRKRNRQESLSAKGPIKLSEHQKLLHENEKPAENNHSIMCANEGKSQLPPTTEVPVEDNNNNAQKSDGKQDVIIPENRAGSSETLIQSQTQKPTQNNPTPKVNNSIKSGEPICTLGDLLNNPETYAQKLTQDSKQTQSGRPNPTETKTLNDASNRLSLSDPRVNDLSTETVKPRSGHKQKSVSISPCAPTSHCHTHHSPPTFFLPRISTDPLTSGSTDQSDLSGLQIVKKIPLRRGSMIVRSGRTNANQNFGNIADAQASNVEGFIVTPFAQILVSMQKIRNAFIRLTAAQTSTRYNVTSSVVVDPHLAENIKPDSPEYKTAANETLEELEWCLKQLENIQTKRPVSDMAFSKFKRLLNKELNSFGESDKSRHQISAYICETFLENEKDAEANKEIESMLERRRSSGQSHSSSALPSEPTNGTKRTNLTVCNEVATQISVKSNDSSKEIKSAPENRISTHSVDASSWKQPIPSSKPGTDDKDESANQQKTLPLHGVETTNDKELDERFNQCLDDWGVDIFEIDRLSNGHPLTTITYRIFQKRDLLRLFSIDSATFIRYLLKLESTYHPDVPYHNCLHAADVIQTSHYLLQAEPLEDVFSDLEILAVLFASAIHDVDHPGLTNQYLINTGHDLALQYNDASVLENHHLYTAFKLISEPDCDVFASLGAKKRQTLRRMVIELVLATDMSKHMSLLADLRTMVETKKVSGSGVLNLDNYADRIQILQNMIHCADLSNPAKPLRLYRKWTGRLIEEFFRQGDKERQLKLEISPMCDRESVAIEKSQVSFIDFVCHPLWETWCDLVHPSAQLILDTLEDNRDWYECQAEDQKGVSKGRPKLATAEEDEEETASN